MPATASATVHTPARRHAQSLTAWGGTLQSLGGGVIRYGLVVVLAWIGLMKFTEYEAEGIRPFVENSPLLAWTQSLFGVRGLADALGVVEVTLALMIALRHLTPQLSAVGSLLAAGTFLATLTFLATTPQAWVKEHGGFPSLAIPGQFLLKDLVLLGAALWTAGEALRAMPCAKCVPTTDGEACAVS